MAQYQILRMETLGTPPLMQPNGQPYVFEDPQDAAFYAKMKAREIGEKLCVKPVIDPEWKAREMNRFARGEYRPLPWVAAGWWVAAYPVHKDHFPHPALEKPGWIAYTKSEEDGAKDKQSLLRPGAYLNRYFQQALNDYGVSERRLVEDFMKLYGPIDIKFAATEEDIVKVYDHGPQTCLHKDKDWPRDIHPASIYAAGDLQIAYIGDINGKVSARTLVWPERKLHSRVYGDIARLTQGLQRLGYKWGAPIGARLKRHELHKCDINGGYTDGCFIAPYLDKKNQAGGGHLSFKDAGDYLIICNEGEPGSHHAGGPDGYSGPYVPRDDEYPTYECELCGEDAREVLQVYTELPAVRRARNWCRDCVDEHGFCCQYSGEFFAMNVPHVEIEGDLWAKYYAGMYAVKCEGSGKMVHRNHAIKVMVDGAVKLYSLTYIEEETEGTFTSELTGHNYFNDQMAQVRTDSWGTRRVCSKSELVKRAFQCDGCDTYWVIPQMHQSLGDDQLFCPNCHDMAKMGKARKSASRKKFEEERKQLPLIAAE